MSSHNIMDDRSAFTIDHRLTTDASIDASPSAMGVPLDIPTPGASGTDLPPLPSISPSSSTLLSSVNSFSAQQPTSGWSQLEIQTLIAGLTQFPSDQFDPVTRYIKIAALLPGKCVRDVALQAKAIATSAFWFPHQQQSPARATKRIKVEGNTQSYQQQTGIQQNVNRGIGELNDNVARQLDALLQDNLTAISTMRANLLGGKVDDNMPQMLRFHNNYDAVMSTLESACASIPPLPVRPDTSLLPDQQIKGEDSSNK